MTTLLLLVIFSAIIILFSKETSAFLKKWYAVYWVRVTVPLLVISWVWIWNDEFILWGLEWLQTQVIGFISEPASLLPLSIQWMMDAIELFLITSLPAWLLYWKWRRKGALIQSQTKIVANVYIFSWVFFIVLLLA